jgi:Transposase DDE domain
LIQRLCGRISTAPELKKDPEDDKCIGKSKGGLSTKIHARVDALGNPTGFHLTAGHASDLEGVDVLLEDFNAGALLADKAFDADERVLYKLEQKGIKAVIV